MERLLLANTAQTWRGATAGIQPVLVWGLFGHTRADERGTRALVRLGDDSLTFGTPMPPTFLYFSQDCHLGPSSSQTLFSCPPAETLRQGWGRSCTLSGVPRPALLSSVLAGAQPLADPPFPKLPTGESSTPRLCQAAGSWATEWTGRLKGCLCFSSSSN